MRLNWEKVFELKFLLHSSPSLPIGNYYSAEFKYKFQHDQLTNLTVTCGNQNHKWRKKHFVLELQMFVVSDLVFLSKMFVVSEADLVFWQKCWEHSPQVGPKWGPRGEYGAQSHCHHHLHCHESTSPTLCRQHKQHCFLNIICHAVLQSSSSILIYLCNIGSSQRSFRLLTSGGAPGGVCDSIAPSRLSHTSHPHQSQANLK